MNESAKVHLSTTTSTLLLEGLKNADNQVVWREYVDRYRPLIVRYGQRLGLKPEDAEDVAQQSLAAFVTAYQQGKYDRDKGRLRTWLFGIARNHILNWRRRQADREVQVGGRNDQTDFFAQLADDDHLARVWEEEWRDAILRQCLAELKSDVEPSTLEAFDLFACRGWTARRVSAQLGISENAVFGAKRRILRRIRELLPQMEEHW